MERKNSRDSVFSDPLIYSMKQCFYQQPPKTPLSGLLFWRVIKYRPDPQTPRKSQRRRSNFRLFLKNWLESIESRHFGLKRQQFSREFCKKHVEQTTAGQFSHCESAVNSDTSLPGAVLQTYSVRTNDSAVRDRNGICQCNRWHRVGTPVHAASMLRLRRPHITP